MAAPVSSLFPSTSSSSITTSSPVTTSSVPERDNIIHAAYRPSFEEVELSPEDKTRLFGNEPSPIVAAPESSSRQCNASMSKSIREFMTPVKDQGLRGTCSVFAAVGLLEYALDYILSEQWIARFNTSHDSGFIRERVEWALSHGLALERACPYDPVTRSIPCPTLGHHQKVRIHFQLKIQFPHAIDPVDFIKAELDQGSPVGASVYVLGLWWNNFNDRRALAIPSDQDIRTFQEAGSSSAHALVITGYDNASQSFEFKNSWGRDWKDDGYGRMSFDYYRRFRTSNALVVVKKQAWDVEKMREEIARSDEASRWLIREWFQAYLGRGANDADVLYHMGNLHLHGNRNQVEAEIARSDEASRWRIRDFFKKHLGRDATAGDITYHLQKIESHGNWEKVETEIARSGEASRWRIQGFFKKHLGRDATAGDITYHLRKVESHGNWEKVETEIAQSDEASRWRIGDFFKKHLGRNATDGDITYHLQKIESHGNWEKVEAEIARSDEASRWFIQCCFTIHLGRPANKADETYHLKKLQEGQTRESVKTEIAHSDEATRWLVWNYYRQYLGREPNARDVQYHLNHFQPYGNWRNLQYIQV